MNKIAILPLKEIPSSCSECGMYKMKSNSDWVVNKVCIHNEKLNIPFFDKSRHPNCSLISIDINELEGAVDRIRQKLPPTLNIATEVVDILTIENLINKLGGKQ